MTRSRKPELLNLKRLLVGFGLLGIALASCQAALVQPNEQSACDTLVHSLEESQPETTPQPEVTPPETRMATLLTYTDGSCVLFFSPEDRSYGREFGLTNVPMKYLETSITLEQLENADATGIAGLTTVESKYIVWADETQQVISVIALSITITEKNGTTRSSILYGKDSNDPQNAGMVWFADPQLTDLVNNLGAAEAILAGTPIGQALEQAGAQLVP